MKELKLHACDHRDRRQAVQGDRGDTLFIEGELASEAGENVTFDKVLAVIDGDKITVGTPVVEGARWTPPW